VEKNEIEKRGLGTGKRARERKNYQGALGQRGRNEKTGAGSQREREKNKRGKATGHRVQREELQKRGLEPDRAPRWRGGEDDLQK